MHSPLGTITSLKMPPTPTNLSSTHSSEPRAAESLSPLHTIIIFLVSTLGGYLHVQYQSGSKSLFDEHRNLLLAIFISLSIYAMGIMADLKLQTQNSAYLSIIRRLTPLIGILVVVLLMMILFPLLGLVAFILWALFMMEASIKLFQEIFQWLRPIFFRAEEFRRRYLNREQSGSSGIGLIGSEENDLSEDSGLPV